VTLIGISGIEVFLLELPKNNNGLWNFSDKHNIYCTSESKTHNVEVIVYGHRRGPIITQQKKFERYDIYEKKFCFLIQSPVSEY